jgi:very-short-patch-repair endonuclease
VTTVPRTIFDLAATEPAEAVEGMLRESEFLRLYDRLSLPDLLARHPGRHGTRVLETALARRGTEPEKGAEPSPERIRSLLEERFLPFLDRHRLPRPRFNAQLEAGGHWHEVDCLWLPQREIAELDGWEGHGTRGAFRADRARDRRLRLAGYGITRLTWSQLDDEPDAIAADLGDLLYKRP